jgi:hypothetical protein
LTRLFEAAGVDFEQWKALTLVALKLDFRTSALGYAGAFRTGRAAAALVGQFIMYVLFGVFLAIFVWMGTDLFLVGTVLTTYVIFMVGTNVLLDHNSALTSPLDYPVLGFRPVSSRTYFAARLANVLVYTTVVTTAVVFLPAASLFVRHGLAVGIAGLFALYGCATSTTLAILLGYVGLLRLVGPHAIKRALSYVQLGFSFFVYGGYFLFTREFARAMMTSLALPKTPWLLLYPGTWFASYLEIAAGQSSLLEVIPAVLSVLAFAAMAAALGGRLSLEYSERLGAVSAMSERARAPRGPGRRALWFRTGEARAAALLIRTQFRNDMRFRMGVLGIVPITVLYIFMGARDGEMRDPFTSSAAQGLSFVSMAVMMFPSMLKLALAYSESYRASWIFFACPADRTRMIRSAKNVLTVFFLLPYLGFVAAVYTYFVGNIWHVAVHISLLGLMSHLCLQFFVLMDPQLPFSKPPQRTRNSGVFMVFLFGMVILSALANAASAWLYASATRAVTAFAAIVLASVAVERLTRARVLHQAQSLEFQG